MTNTRTGYESLSLFRIQIFSSVYFKMPKKTFLGTSVHLYQSSKVTSYKEVTKTVEIKGFLLVDERIWIRNGTDPEGLKTYRPYESGTLEKSQKTIHILLPPPPPPILVKL
jgi:hypothetical protein